MKRFLFSFLCLLLFAGCEDKKKLPDGFEIINSDGRSHFVYVDSSRLGDKVIQRETARRICKNIFVELDYCEVYYFDNKEDIPKKFPIMNRLRPIGTYELKGDKEKFDVLR